MQTSSFFQTTAAQTGVISSPLVMAMPLDPNDPRQTFEKGVNLEGNRVMMADGTEHVLQGAFQGKPSVDLTASRQITNEQTDALKAQALNYNYSPNLQQAAITNATNQHSNGAPIMQRGNVLMYDETGQPVNVPMAFAQQMAYTDAVNQGRADSVKQYLGGGQAPENMSYRSNAQRDNLLNKANADLSGVGAVTPYFSNQQQAKTLTNEIYQMDSSGSWNDLTQDPNSDLNYATENFNSLGQGERILSRGEQVKQQLAAIPQSSQSLRQARQQEANQARAITEMMKELERTRPTYASVPIQETIVA
jgi:hypothetical protein